MNEWERERRRTNTLQSPGEGNTWAASAPGSIPSSKGSAFHIPAGLPTPGCRMLWTGASTYSLSVHDQTFLFAQEVGAGPTVFLQTAFISAHWYFSTSKNICEEFSGPISSVAFKSMSVIAVVSVAHPIGAGSILLIPMAPNLYE